jgi:hypothetical protein
MVLTLSLWLQRGDYMRLKQRQQFLKRSISHITFGNQQRFHLSEQRVTRPGERRKFDPPVTAASGSIILLHTIYPRWQQPLKAVPGIIES